MKTKLRVKTLFMSDVHLGMPDSKAVQAAHFLRHCECAKIVLNGDIIGIVGFYVITSMTLNTMQAGVPDGKPLPLPVLAK